MGSQQQPLAYGEGSYGTDRYSPQHLPAQTSTNYTEQHPTAYRDLPNIGSQRQDFSSPQRGTGQQSPGGLHTSTQRQNEEGASENTRDLPIRERPRVNPTSSSKPTQRICMSCNQPLTGQFVRAIGGTFHLECFRCKDCGEVVASKFFPVDDEEGSGQYPLCETDYFRRLDLLCFNCGGALRGSYVTALDRKYHIDHFTCSVCPTAFGAKDSYYEHDGMVYCHYHYSTRFAQRCNGCQTAILKQFVEIFRNGQNQHWHPECYMIHKFWNVRLAKARNDSPVEPPSEEDATEEQRNKMRDEEEMMEERTYRIWSVLSQFEESSAACISDMLLHVSNGAYMEGVLVAKKFITYVDVLFGATDRLDSHVISAGKNGLSYGREAKLLCKRIVSFFTLLTKTQDTGVKRLGVTQELLSLVTGLAHYLKLLIRISLQGALKLEKDTGSSDGLHVFLDDLTRIEELKEADPSLETSSMSELAEEQSDLCSGCQQPIDDECLRSGNRRWHPKHLVCENCHREIGDEPEPTKAVWLDKHQQAFCANCKRTHVYASDSVMSVERVSRLSQYIYLLRIALARLLAVLRSSGTLPHTSDDPNLSTFDSNEGHRLAPGGGMNPPMLSPETRSKSFGGVSPSADQPQSSYEQTVGEMKRLRSTRMEKHLSTTLKKARTSRIIDGPEAQNLASGVNLAERRKSGFHIVEDQDANGDIKADLAFGNQDALTLDDIPRIVAAEQAKEQRPNAFRHAQSRLLAGGRQPKLMGGHQRDVGDQGDPPGADNYPVERTGGFFSELSGLEYFIVRHVAVLQMQPLLEPHFNLEELLGLIETRKQTFWGKIFKNDKPKGGKKKGVFGVSLDALVERDGVESTYGVGPGALRVPSLLDEAIAAMRGMDMSVEGVFRKNGNIRGLKDLAERIDSKEGEVDLTKESPVQVAALLKKFLREMPDPLLTHKLHDLFITSQKITDETKRKRVLHLTCCLLPKTHRDSLEILFSFLNWAASFSQVDEESGSKMDTHNLATVIAPNILYADPKAGASDESFLAIEAINMLLDWNDQLCEVPEDIQSVLSDTDLFNNMPEVTTKEILKRYGDIAKQPDRHYVNVKAEVADMPVHSQDTSGSKSRAGAPAITRVDTDPNQVHAWQKESSVRHVQQNGAPSYPSTNHNTPPQLQTEFGNRNSPYHYRTGSSDSIRSNGTPNRHSHRPSNFQRQAAANGYINAAGAG